MSFPSVATRLDVFEAFLCKSLYWYMDYIGVFNMQNEHELSDTRRFIQAQADEWLCDRESGEIHEDTPAPGWVVYGSHRNGFEGISDDELTTLGSTIMDKCILHAFVKDEPSEA